MDILYYRVISITISALCLLICLLVAGIYFSKKKLITKENSIYSYLLVFNIISLVSELIFYLTSFTSKAFWVDYLEKAFFAATGIWMFIYTLYIMVVTDKNGSIGPKNMPFEKKKKSVYFVVIIIFSLIFFSPVKNIYQDDYLVSSSGLSTIFMFLISFGLIAYDVVLVLRSIRKIKSKKIYSLLLFLFLIAVELIANVLGVKLILITFPMTFASFLMYHTIENPDIKMLEEVTLAREEADKANQAKTEFLSSMSHEIRTPLNAIVGFSQNLYEDDISNAAKEQVADIITASNNLLELVNGILDISKIEANKLEIVNDEYSFRRVFNELVSLAHARMGDKALIFKTYYDEAVPKVLYGDKLRVKQVILNILTNSIKYTKKGFVEFKVSSIIKDDVCRLIISVEDSGVGIKKENIDKLFTKFQRFEERNTTIEGTGLGLAITKKLVELMGGQIIVQSVYGQGSKFTIAIDQKVINNPTIDLEESNKVIEVNESLDFTGKRVLIVDDNKMNLKVAARLLEKYNINIELVASGFECINKINSGEVYDLILLDDMMPKMSGVETFIELKKNLNYSIPTVILTANAIAGMRDKYINIDGFDDYLAKPIEKAELNRVLKKFLKKEE